LGAGVGEVGQELFFIKRRSPAHTWLPTLVWGHPSVLALDTLKRCWWWWWCQSSDRRSCRCRA
jgi:hypothetical protein